MKVGIVGTGRVAQALGSAWARCGHDLFIVGRDPEPAAELANQLGPRSRPCTAVELADHAEVILLAVPWLSIREVLDEVGSLAGKVLIDCINPLRPSDFTRPADLGGAASTADQLARWLPDARIVKAFNTVSAATMRAPRFGGQSATMPFCGDDVAAKAAVGRLIVDAGFEPLDVGGLDEAPLLESLALLSIRLVARRRLGADLGWKLLQRDPTTLG